MIFNKTVKSMLFNNISNDENKVNIFIKESVVLTK